MCSGSGREAMNRAKATPLNAPPLSVTSLIRRTPPVSRSETCNFDSWVHEVGCGYLCRCEQASAQRVDGLACEIMTVKNDYGCGSIRTGPGADNARANATCY